MKGDVRTPDKLVDGVNDTYDEKHMWLAPFSPTDPNVIHIIFQRPVKIAALLIWNYAKTPARGVGRFQVFADDCIIYDGCLRASKGPSVMSRAPFSTLPEEDQHQSVLFTDRPDILEREKSRIVNFSAAKVWRVWEQGGRRVRGRGDRVCGYARLFLILPSPPLPILKELCMINDGQLLSGSSRIESAPKHRPKTGVSGGRRY